jgi:type I restriction enzyme S subunit
MLGENLLALENLVKSASVGLPAEIAARRKQYEYYRDKLLTFKELDVA